LKEKGGLIQQHISFLNAESLMLTIEL